MCPIQVGEVLGKLAGIEDAGVGVGKQRAKPTSPIGVRFVQAGEHYLVMNHREFEFAGKRFSSNHSCFIEVPRLGIAQGRIPEKIVQRLKTRGVFFRLHWGQHAPPGSRDAAREYPALRKWLGARVVFGAGPRLLSQEHPGPRTGNRSAERWACQPLWTGCHAVRLEQFPFDRWGSWSHKLAGRVPPLTPV